MKLSEKIDQLIAVSATLSQKVTDLDVKVTATMADHEKRLRSLERGYQKALGIIILIGIVIDVVIRMVKF